MPRGPAVVFGIFAVLAVVFAMAGWLPQLIGLLVIVAVIVGLLAIGHWLTTRPPSTPLSPPAPPLPDDIHAIAGILYDAYTGSAYPRDLLQQEAFRRGVEIFASDRHEPDELLQYAAGVNPILACMALEALGRRTDGGNPRDALLGLLNTDYRWPRYYVLRALAARGAPSIVGAVVTRLNETWAEPVSRTMLQEFFAARVEAGEPLTVAGHLHGVGRAQLDVVAGVLGTLDATLVAPLVGEIRRWRAVSVDLTELETFGRRWTTDDFERDDVLSAETEEAAETLCAELTGARPRSVMLVGDPGTGRTTLIRAVARRLADDGWILFEATAADLIAGQSYIGQLEGRVQKFVELIGGRKVLWISPNAHELLWTGTHRYSPTGLLDMLLPHLERGDVRLIGETSPAAWDRLSQERPKLRSLFSAWRLSALTAGQTLALAREWLHLRAARGQPNLSDATLQEAFQLVQHYLGDRAMPGSLLNFLSATQQRVAAAGAATITPDDLVATLGEMTGVPARILDERVPLDLGELRQFFERRVMGQPEAVESLVDRVAMIKAGLTDPTRPLGVFLFVGPTGTGKTEIAKTLAEFLFSSPDRMIRLDMSEFQTPDSLERLLGGSPEATSDAGGLVGAIRKQPFSVVLLDEFEKSAPPVWNLFLQVFDDGRLTDRRGVSADFRHAVLILTSNLGAAVAAGAGIGFTGEEGAFSPSAVDKTLARTFPPEFLNRLDRIVVFRPLSRGVMREILRKELTAVLQRRGLRTRTWAVEWDESAIDFLFAKGFTPHLGARPLKRAIERYLLAPLAATIVNREVPAGDQFLFVRSDGERLDVVFVDPDAPEPDVEVTATPAVAAAPEPATEPAAGSSLEAIVLNPRGTQIEIETVDRAYRRLADRLGTAPWTKRKDEAFAEMKRPDFWDSPERFRVLGLAEFLDRLDDALNTAGSLLRRLGGGRGAGRERAPRDLVQRLAQLLYLMEGACDGVDAGRPRDAFLAVAAVHDAAGTEDARASDEFARRLGDMYVAWAKTRRMRFEVVVDGKSERPYRSALAVSGFAAYPILAREIGLHVNERSQDERSFNRIRARVSVVPQPDEPATGAGGLRAQAQQALGGGAVSDAIVRRYRETPSPLVRDSVRGWRTGRLDLVLAGNFDVIV